jgi:hypothetical protein
MPKLYGIAKNDYNIQSTNDILLKKDDYLLILSNHDSWKLWVQKQNGASGWVPDSYVQIINERPLALNSMPKVISYCFTSFIEDKIQPKKSSNGLKLTNREHLSVLKKNRDSSRWMVIKRDGTSGWISCKNVYEIKFDSIKLPNFMEIFVEKTSKECF